jgi:hypothetical protein
VREEKVADPSRLERARRLQVIELEEDAAAERGQPQIRTIGMKRVGGARWGGGGVETKGWEEYQPAALERTGDSISGVSIQGCGRKGAGDPSQEPMLVLCRRVGYCQYLIVARTLPRRHEIRCSDR